MTIEQLFGHTTSNVSEDHFEKVFGGLLEGVMGGLENECRVIQSAVAAMTVEVMTGTFVTGGVFARVSAQDVLVIPVADAVNPRIDRVACRRDNATDTVTVYVLAGTPAGAPVPTALTRAGGIWEISLAQVYVAALAPNITRANIADERRSRPVCGLISPNGSPDALFPLVNNPGQVGGAEGALDSVNGIPGTWGLLAGPTLVGAGAGASSMSAHGLLCQMTSGGVIGNDAGWSSPIVTRRELNPALRVKPVILAAVDVRVFYGLTLTNLATIVGSDAPATSYVGLQFSTDRGDTTWQFVAGDGVGQTIFDSEVTVTTDPVILLILADEANDQFTLVLMDSNGDVVAGCTFDDASDNVPAAATNLRFVVGLETRVGGARSIGTYTAHLVNRIP